MLESMRFNGVWRDYQQRVLDEFEHHLDDNRVNVVAAPGSGKTVLGLELVRRLGRPALVLAPSLTIRNQWAERLVPLFMERRPPDGFTSFSLDEPAEITAATYQSLHAIWADTDSARFDALVDWAKAHAPVTLVLDEAHHLRREWWRALNELGERLDAPRIVALTATPPYDAPFAEWTRFEEMCGPIDIEIGIPELVRNGDLCPHQDHVILSRPSPDLLSLLDKRREAISALLSELRGDDALAEALESHPFLTEPESYLEDILDRPTIVSSILVHLAAVGRPLPSKILKILGVRAETAPMQDARWTEALLNALLYDLADLSSLDPFTKKHLEQRLAKNGLIEGKRVRLGETRRIVRMMAGDRAKMESILDIARREAAQRGGDLRMVILADHVRAAELPRSADAPFKPTKIGVAPIFEILRRNLPDAQTLGVLTGSLVIVPSAAITTLHALAEERGMDPSDLFPRALPHCSAHCRIEASGPAKRSLVAFVTELFQRGEITMLVGTQALLGEGWDAPAIDSLVLASNSASYMLSNQMRGRAIRTDPNNPSKVSNIWHLATVSDPDALSGLAKIADDMAWGRMAHGRAVSADMDLLTRRFEAFAGISNDALRRIGTGLSRLGLERHSTIEAANEASFARASDRAAIARDWAISLGDAPPRAHVREIALPTHTPKRMIWENTLEALGISGAATGATAGSYAMIGALGVQPFTILLAGGATAATIASLPKAGRALMLAWRNGTLENRLYQVGRTILFGLWQAGYLSEDEFDDADVETDSALDGSRMIFFEGLGRGADLIAMEALSELLGPIQNPRYLLVRKGGLLNTGTDFHAIPALFSKNRAAAEAFAEEWSARIGPCRAVFTRSEEGRSVLLKARRASLAAGLQRRVQRRSDWR